MRRLRIAQLNSVSSNPSTIDATALRIDHQFSDKLRIFARYDHAPSSGTNPNGISPQARQYQLNTLTVGATFVFRPNVTNDLRYNYSRSVANTIEELPKGVSVTNDQYGRYLPGVTLGNGYVQTVLSFNDQFSYVVWGTNSSNEQTQWNAVDKIAWSVGKHQLDFGADFRMLTTSEAGFPGLKALRLPALRTSPPARSRLRYWRHARAILSASLSLEPTRRTHGEQSQVLC